MVPWPFGWEALSCFVAKNNSELVVFLRDHLLPGAFFRFGGIESQLGRDGGLSDMDVIGGVHRRIGSFLLWRWEVACVGSYPSLELSCSPVDDGVVCGKKGHSKKHGVSSEIYDEEWVCIGLPLVMNLEVSDLGDFSYTVLGSVYITDGSGIGEILGWNREITDYVWRNEVFGCATVN